MEEFPDVINADQSSLPIPLLHHAIYCGRTDVVKALLEGGTNADAVGRWRETALHIACTEDNTKIVQTLIDYGADINAQDEGDQTPLHVAFRRRNNRVILFLLEKGANPELSDDEGRTAEKMGRESGDPSIIKLLDLPPAPFQAGPRRKGRTVFAKPRPDSDRRSIILHNYFKGLLWHPQSDSRPTTVSDLMYGDMTKSVSASKRWVHLPFNNVSPLASVWTGQQY